MKQKVSEEYPNGECPDCGLKIPDDTEHEESCSNCGHVWNEVQEADDS